MTNDERQEEIFAGIEQNPGNPDAYWPLVVEFVADWLAHLPLDFPMALQISDRWREEMS